MKNTELLQQNTLASLHFFESELFKEVQLSGLFDDSKTFADAIPKIALSEISQHYQIELKGNIPIDLKKFIAKYFDLSEDSEITIEESKVCIDQHIQALWHILKKTPDYYLAGSLLPLQKPYIVPGGRFREIYYWDSYFTSLGLIESKQITLVESMLENFIDLQSRYGLIPNGNRSYYLSRSQPPILGLLVELLLPYKKDKQAFIHKNIAGVEAEYQFWMQGHDRLSGTCTEHKRVVKMPNGSYLNRYWDDNASPRPESYLEDIELLETSKPDDSSEFYRNIRAACESGWDFSSRWLGDDHSLASIRTTRIIPVDLNCLLYKQEKLLSNYYAELGNTHNSLKYTQYSQARKLAIQHYMWSENHSFYMDFDLDKKTVSSIKSLAGILPLFVELADPKQAQQVSQQIESLFLKEGGLVTTVIDSTQQWDSPNGWAPLHWFVAQGLLNYQLVDLAGSIQQRWLDTVEKYFLKTGKIMEKYNVLEQSHKAEGGEYDVQEGFGWTNGIYQAFSAQIKKRNSVK